ncbi:transmembrane signal receptor [Lithospermum erythrorhizon]|uniref:Transmembrane signal receptor n=1 Tax=Lithospermum erythrorhizon TaxID=34254 RepID=A0AAV3NNI9_LITER
MPLLARNRVVAYKWIYKIKLKSDGSIERYKVRLVCILIVVMSHALQGITILPGSVCRLKKSLYGLKEASRKWFSKLSQTLVSLGYKQFKNDYYLYAMHNDGGTVIVAVYVDDILVIGSNLKAITDLKAYLHNHFSIKDLEFFNYFLDFEIVKVDSDFDYSARGHKQYGTLLPLNTKLKPDAGGLLSNREFYRSMVGKLNFLVNTISYLSFSVQTLSQLLQQPREPHLEALQHLLYYVYDTATQGLVIQGSTPFMLEAFSNSD